MEMHRIYWFECINDIFSTVISSYNIKQFVVEFFNFLEYFQFVSFQMWKMLNKITKTRFTMQMENETGG